MLSEPILNLARQAAQQQQGKGDTGAMVHRGTGAQGHRGTGGTGTKWNVCKCGNIRAVIEV